MMRFFAIARNAFVEALRQPIYGVLILITFVVLVLDLPLSGWTMGRGAAEYAETDQQMMVNLGLSTLLVSGLFMAAFSASGVLSREIEEKTILTVVSKPVVRPVIVLGKFAGVAAALIIAYYLCSLVFLMTVRHKVMPTAGMPYDFPVIILGTSAIVGTVLAAIFCNYFFGWHFVPSAVGFGVILLSMAMAVIAFIGKGWRIVPFGQDISPDILAAMLLMLFGVLILVAVAVAASTRLGQAMTLLVCFAFFLASSMTQYLFGQFADGNIAARAANLAWTNLTFFYTMEALVSSRSIPIGYVGWTAAYAACHIVAILAIGMALFQRRELVAQAGSASTAAPTMVSAMAWIGRAAAVAAGVLAMSLPWKFGILKAVAFASGLGVLAVFGWVLAGLFGRGAKWTYFFVFICAGVATCLAGAAILRSPAGLGNALPVVTGCLAVVLILLLPRTRRHFGFVRKSEKPRQTIV